MKVPDGSSTTVYRCGAMIDLCVGPHIPHTVSIQSPHGYNVNDLLQRIYGILFPDKTQLSEYKEFLAEAARREHRKIGKEQKLFFFNDLSPGGYFWRPHGTHVYNTLVELMRSEYIKRGYQEVVSCNIDLCALAELQERHALKLMNFPGHCLIFDSRDRSYKELPICMAEFWIVHRNEVSGTLTGLTRVCRFVQDDMHVFCMPSQEEEIYNLFDFMQHIMTSSDSTSVSSCRRGLTTTWARLRRGMRLRTSIEESLGQAISRPVTSGRSIPATAPSTARRSTSQFAMRCAAHFNARTSSSTSSFRLKYRSADDTASADKPPSRPVIIHRAILGSLEWFIAIITEHFARKWLFWLSPLQALVVPTEYASEVAQKLSDLRLFADVDSGDNVLPIEIRDSEITQYDFTLTRIAETQCNHYMTVLGQEELGGRSVNIRDRDDISTKAKGHMIPLEEVVQKLIALKNSRSLKKQFV
ncbi:predicted protein [Postia placenta Mad-698-R]|nr:predicted protein [Postia placenta Mad-698-R]